MTDAAYAIFLDHAGTEALSFAPLSRPGSAGWARFFSPAISQQDVTLLRIGFLRPPNEGDREQLNTPLGIRELQFAVEDGAMAAQLVRDLPFGRIVAAVNQPRHYQVLTQYVSAHMFVLLPASGPWRLQFPERAASEKPKLKLRIPGGRQKKPDEFYRQVADAFAWLAATSTSPAADLAAKNNVPVTTVHRWVKEARSRGALPPATGRGRRTNSDVLCKDQT